MLCFGVTLASLKYKPPSSCPSVPGLLFKSYCSGILSGMLGIGGGLIINPLLLNMGYLPLVASALSAFVVLFTSASTSTQFLILGAFDLKNAVYVALLSTVGSIIGCIFLRALMKKYKRYFFDFLNL